MNRVDIPPVIVLGAHRSGTTLLADILGSLGVFMGRRFGVNHEAFFFQRLNEWLMQTSGGAWDFPEPVKNVLLENKARTSAEIVFKEMVDSRLFREFYKYSRQRRGLSQPWGWKDPRNCFTFPLWAQVFPSPAMILILRDPFDVCLSLTKRAQGQPLGGSPIFQLRNRWQQAVRSIWSPMPEYHLRSLRARTLTGSFEIWKEYVAEALVNFESYEGRKLLIRYENLLHDRKETVRTIARFVVGEIDDIVVGRAASLVKERVEYVIRSESKYEELVVLLASDPLVKKLGYGVSSPSVDP